MNRFRQKFKSIDFGPQNDPFPHFRHNQKFLSKSKTITLNHFFMPVNFLIPKEIKTPEGHLPLLNNNNNKINNNKTLP